jgi:hypothetical protein
MLNLRNHRQCPAGGFSVFATTHAYRLGRDDGGRAEGSDTFDAERAIAHRAAKKARCKPAPGAPNRSTVKLRGARKTLSLLTILLLCFVAAVQETRFVHLPFRLKSALVGVA